MITHTSRPFHSSFGTLGVGVSPIIDYIQGTFYLIKQSNPQSHVDLHLLFLELTSDPVLDNNICRVLSRISITP
jgi:hypothetical protein